MSKKQMIGLVVAVLLFIFTGISSVLTNTFATRSLEKNVETILAGGTTFDAPNEDYVGIVQIVGTIAPQEEKNLFQVTQSYQHDTIMESIDQMMMDVNNVGISLYVDSPGGTVYESEEMYLKLMEYKELTGRPIWCYMAHYGASGGYMIPMAADYICTNSNTVTGSIGVIMAGYDMSGLYEKLGIRYVSITSGVNKDSSTLTDEQIAIFQDQINEYYERFVEIVSEGRGMSTEQVKKLADGRTYTAKQAVENGLTDEICNYDTYMQEVYEEFGTTTTYKPESPLDVFGSFFGKLETLVPKSEAQILLEAAQKMESGVPMYYAEQLQ